MKIVHKIWYCSVFVCLLFFEHRGNVTVKVLYLERVYILLVTLSPYYCLIRWTVFEETVEARFQFHVKHEYILHCITFALVKQFTVRTPKSKIHQNSLRKFLRWNMLACWRTTDNIRLLRIYFTHVMKRIRNVIRHHIIFAAYVV
jgi:hypothetical protein